MARSRRQRIAASARAGRRQRTHKPQGHHLTGKQMRALYYGEGGDPRSVMEKASRGQRHRIRRRASRQGVTVEGWIRGGPKWLRERSPSGIQRAATRTVAAGYRPAERDLNNRAVKEHALDTKRRQDEAVYAQWAAGKQKEMASQASAADAAVMAASSQAEQQAQAQLQAQQGAQAQAIQARGGLVDQAAAAQGPNLDIAQNRAQAQIQAQREATRQQVAQGNTARSAYGSSALAFGEARRGRMEENFRESMRAINEERGKLHLSKAGDIAREIARLRDQQIDVAGAQAERQIASTKLGVDVAKTRETHRHNVGMEKNVRRGQNIQAQRNRWQREIARLDQRIKSGALSVKQQALAQKRQKDIQDHLDKISGQGVTKRGQDIGLEGKREGRRATQHKANQKIWNQVIGVLQNQRQKPAGKRHTSTWAYQVARRAGMSRKQALRAVRAAGYNTGHVKGVHHKRSSVGKNLFK